MKKHLVLALAMSLLGTASANELKFEQKENKVIMKVLSGKLRRGDHATEKTVCDIIKVAVAGQTIFDAYKKNNSAENFLADAHELVDSFIPFFELLSLAGNLVEESLNKHDIDAEQAEVVALMEEDDQKEYMQQVFSDAERAANFFREVRAVRRCLLANLSKKAKAAVEAKVGEEISGFAISEYM